MRPWFVVTFLLASSALQAQPAPGMHQATLSGMVRHDSTGAPLAGVEVLINGTTYRTETSAAGRYLLTGLPAGTYQVIFRKLGHLPVRIDARLVTGDTTRANTTLIESAVVLDPVIVTGTPSLKGVGVGREGFEERRKMGLGRFFDGADLRRHEELLKVEDLLTRHAGVDVAILSDAMGGRERVAIDARRSRANNQICVLQVYYNGSPVGKGGVWGVSDVVLTNLQSFSLSGLESIEVYRSAAEVPVEYSGSSAGCGVILLWSRRGP